MALHADTKLVAIGSGEAARELIIKGERNTIKRLTKSGNSLPQIANWMGLPFDYVDRQAKAARQNGQR